MISRVGFQVFINSSVLKKVLRIFHTYSKTGWPCHMGLQLKMEYPPIWRDYISWLVVLTILKNTSQWEGLAHILWKKNMFETTNQYHILTSFINLTMAKTRVVHGYPPFSDSQKYKYPAVHSYEPLPMYKCDLPIQNGGFPYIYIHIILYYILLYHIQSYYAQTPWFARTATLRIPFCRTWEEKLQKILRIRSVSCFRIQSFQGFRV